MALGALLKVKMDATAVARGLRRIRSGFGALGGAISRVRGAWGKLKGSAMAAAFGAIAQQVQNTAQWMARLRNETEALGESTKEVMTIKEALEISGVDPGQAGGMLNEMKRRLAESMESRDSEPGRALKLLGLNPKELFQMKGGQAFRTIMNAVRTSDKNENQLIRALDQLFGGAGMEAFGLAKDFPERMELAAEAVAELADAFDKKGVDGIQKMQVRMSQFRNSMRLFWMELIDKLPLDLVAELVKTISLQAPKILEGLIAFFKDPMGEGSPLKAIADWFKNLFTEITSAITEAIESVKEFIQGIVDGIIRLLFPDPLGAGGGGGAGGPTSMLEPGDKFTRDILNETKEQNRHLRNIERGGAVFA